VKEERGEKVDWRKEEGGRDGGGGRGEVKEKRREKVIRREEGGRSGREVEEKEKVNWLSSIYTLGYHRCNFFFIKTLNLQKLCFSFLILSNVKNC
jgi:regulator of replication initiation timing